jgi:hypothetical protein
LRRRRKSSRLEDFLFLLDLVRLRAMGAKPFERIPRYSLRLTDRLRGSQTVLHVRKVRNHAVPREAAKRAGKAAESREKFVQDQL